MAVLQEPKLHMSRLPYPNTIPCYLCTNKDRSDDWLLRQVYSNISMAFSFDYIHDIKFQIKIDQD